ncbi:uncharacterized protein LOC126839974 isoform X2 [Adelges cooleyi]|uniref:uncharacterized protein LOC126839973 n=1 Tax=Adelges cooleyi TaxID=133065 RepID=UPI00217F9927|nr:uncharacterized protein LOC126839973 [Adelges cooleyi]XP_050431398.1 uncharacterized protein LOC126839974 isoform X1 [Adelges cooleyi]XP_050431399.1 uncharacterized protein LOC126839974 isoform X2 [Adelges cooleyi]
MKAKYLIVMCFIFINNYQMGKTVELSVEKAEQSEETEFDLNEARFDDLTEEETDQVIDAIWNFADKRNKGFIFIGTLAHKVFAEHRVKIIGWLKLHPGLTVIGNNRGRINKINFKLLLYATISLPDLKDILSKLQQTRDSSSSTIV